MSNNNIKDKEKSANTRREIIAWVRSILIAVLAALLINAVIIVNASVKSGSMETNIMTGDRVMGNRLAYLAGEVQRYDVVIFKFEGDGFKDNFVKRVIGLPGETLEVRDGKVFIGDSTEPLADYFIRGEPMGDFGPVEIPAGHYFMMGDNRNESFDSRMWTDPFIARDKILGKLLFVYFPSVKTLDRIED